VPGNVSLKKAPSASRPTAGRARSWCGPFRAVADLTAKYRGQRGEIGDGLIDDPVSGAVFNPVTGELEAIPQLSGHFSYQHWWNEKLRTNAVYSWIYIDNLDIHAPTELRRTKYALIDLIWSPYEDVDLGIEAL
jgi:hypothetical protein